jgi:hypothetical protein
VNALINTPSDIDLRVALRNEFNGLNMKELIEYFKKTMEGNEESYASLAVQIDIYDEEDNFDTRELQDRFADLDIDVK